MVWIQIRTDKTDSRFVGPDLGPNCWQRANSPSSTADKTTCTDKLCKHLAGIDVRLGLE